MSTSAKEADALQTKEEIDALAVSAYSLRDLNAPVISGPPLRFFVALLESPLAGYLLRRYILNASGFTPFLTRAAEATATDISIPPRDLPIHYPVPSPAPPATLAQLDALFHALSPSPPIKRLRPTIRDYQAAYISASTTPTRVAETLLRHVEASNLPDINLNAVLQTNRADVLAQAEASTARWARGAPLSVLDGVPYTVKDSLDASGYPTRFASGLQADEAPQLEDSDVVRALRSAGMVLIGKCNQDELGVGVRGFSMFTGQVRNPHNTMYVPGGSSGGCAAAVAAGLGPVSVGTDSGGSVRIPSACCGVFGLKPSFARVSTFGRVLTERDMQVDRVSPVMHAGPMAACAEDLALMYYVLACFAPHRAIPSEPEFHGPGEVVPGNISRGVAGLRVGVCLPWVRSTSDIGYSAVRDAIDRMISQGAVEVPVVIPDLEDVRVSLSVAVVTNLLHSLKQSGYSAGEMTSSIGYDPRSKLRIGELFTEEYIARSKIVRTKTMEYCVKELFGANKLDVLITPALGVETPKVPSNINTGLVDVNTDSKMMRFASYGNYTGIPACVIPVMKDKRTGLPHAVQIMAAPWNEGKLLDICLWAEKEFKVAELMDPAHYFNPLENDGDNS